MPELDPAVYLGSQYYVETGATPAQIRLGIGAKARAGLKLVRIFLQWTHVAPRQDRWDWSQYDALFAAAAEGGLGVVVTLTALHPPGWMKISSGPQDLGPLDDPVYMERAKDYVRRAARRYASHPALHSWILTNEPTLFLPRDEAVLRRFQSFVEYKYGGDIEALNRRSFQQLDSFTELTLAGSEGGPSGYTGRVNWLDFMVYRLMEILATSLRPLELLWGKLLGLGALAITQVVVWTLAGLLIAGSNSDAQDFITGVSFQPGDMAILVVLFVLNFLVFSAIMLGIGAAVTAEAESRQMACCRSCS
jgi:hypothetical protein